MEILFIQFSDDFKKIYPYDWFCGPGSQLCNLQSLGVKNCLDKARSKNGAFIPISASGSNLPTI